MVGGGSSTNVFAALGSLKKKKKKNKEQGSSKAKGSASEEPEKKEVFWAPAPLTAKSWADVDDEDDDDYYATTAPPQSVWGAPANSEIVNENEAALEVFYPNIAPTLSCSFPTRRWIRGERMVAELFVVWIYCLLGRLQVAAVLG